MVSCPKCGADMPGDALYCPRCGTAATGEERREKESCWDGSRWERDWGRDWSWGDWKAWMPEDGEGWMKRWSWVWSPEWIMINLVFLGLAIVFTGLTLFLAASGAVPFVDRSNFWAYLLAGIGALLVLRGAARFFVAGRLVWPGDITGGLVLVTVGATWLAAQATGWAGHVWAFIIVAGGLAIIVAGIVNYLWMKSRRPKKER